MINSEFSNQFDTMLNSYASQAMFGEETTKQTVALDEYEKSLFLTRAQEDIVLSLYNGKNPYGEAFEITEELRRYLSSLVMETDLTPSTGASVPLPVTSTTTSFFFTLPSNLWFIILEQVSVNKGKCGSAILNVYPIKHDEYLSIKNNPFRGANSRRALRLDVRDKEVEIVCKYPVVAYFVRYLKKLSPIILVDLPDDLSINGISKATECKVHETLHQRILERAVALALQSKGYNAQRDNNNNNNR